MALRSMKHKDLGLVCFNVILGSTVLLEFGGRQVRGFSSGAIGLVLQRRS